MVDKITHSGGMPPFYTMRMSLFVRVVKAEEQRLLPGYHILVTAAGHTPKDIPCDISASL